MVLWVALCGVLRIFTRDPGVFILFIAAGIWLQLYLAGQYIVAENHCLVKYSGRLFRRKTVILMKNICWVQTMVFRPWLPGIMKIVYPHQNVYLIGLTGRQLETLCRSVLTAQSS